MAEKKKKNLSLALDPLLNVKDTMVTKMQTIGKAIKPFCGLRFSDEDKEDTSSVEDSKKSSPTPWQQKSESAEISKSRSLQLPTPPVKGTKHDEKNVVKKASLSLKTAKIPRAKTNRKRRTSPEKVKEPRRKIMSKEEKKLRKEVASLTNELARLQAYDETSELHQLAHLAAEEFRVVEGIFKGARHAIRNLFRQSADEVQIDKELNWSQTMTLETMIGKEIENQKKLGQELDSIIATLERMEKENKGVSKKEDVYGLIITALLLVIFAILAPIVLYKICKILL